MKKLTIYPFDRDFLPVARMGKNDEYLFTRFVSPRGWGYEGVDAGAIDLGEPLGTLVSSDFEEALKSSDALLVAQHNKHLEKELILKKIYAAIDAGKDVVSLFKLNKGEQSDISKKCRDKGVNFFYFNNAENIGVKLSENIVENEIKKIGTPVIAVFSITENINKFHTQLELHRYIKENDYKASVVCSRSYGNFLGFHSVPDFLFSATMPEADRIIRFNEFIRKIEQVEQPDVIILGVPGAILPTSRKMHNYFGVIPYYITRAVEPDAAILCGCAGNYSEGYLQMLDNICKYRFSTDVDGMLLDNTIIEFHGQGTPESVSFMHVPPKNIEVRTVPGQLISIYPFSQRNELFESIINTLSGYAENESL